MATLPHVVVEATARDGILTVSCAPLEGCGGLRWVLLDGTSQDSSCFSPSLMMLELNDIRLWLGTWYPGYFHWRSHVVQPGPLYPQGQDLFSLGLFHALTVQA